MPLYHYNCKCGHSFDAYQYIDLRSNVICPNCNGLADHQFTPTVNIATGNWANGVYEDITSHPITITGGKKELAEVCNKYGVVSKALASVASTSGNNKLINKA